MSEVLAAFQGFLAARDSLDEARLLLEIARHHIAHKFVGIPPLLGGGVRELCFEFRGEMNFHALIS
jgi:hypothetical protein